jgi:phage-related protein
MSPIEEMARGCYGYGRWDAPYWFIGLEEGMSGTLGEQIEAWQQLGEDGLMPSLKDGLREVRSRLPSQKTARLILCFHKKTVIVLHGFIKKTQETPTEELELAKRRLKEVTQ